MPSRPSEGEREELSPLRVYLNQADQTPLLTLEEEKRLAAEIHKGQAARTAQLATGEKTLSQHLQKRNVRRVIQGLRPLLSPSFLERAQELTSFRFHRRLPEALLEAAFAIARQKLQFCHQQALDTETREMQETLLGIARFTEETLLGLAKRLLPPSERERWQQNAEAILAGEKARDHLCKANLLLVVSIAQRWQFRRGELSLLDKIQEGNLALLKAVDEFDPETYGTRFSTYAGIHIEGNINRALQNQTGTIRRPVYVHEMVEQFRKALQKLESACGHKVPVDEGIEKLQRKPRDRETLRLGLRLADVRPFVFEDGNERSGVNGNGDDTEAADAARERVEEFRDRVRGLLGVLTEREAQVVTLRLGLNGTEPKVQREIGELFGFTRARAQQLEVQAIAKLQAAVDGPRAGNGNGNGKTPAKNGRPRGKASHSGYAHLFQSIGMAGKRNGRE